MRRSPLIGGSSSKRLTERNYHPGGPFLLSKWAVAEYDKRRWELRFEGKSETTA